VCGADTPVREPQQQIRARRAQERGFVYGATGVPARPPKVGQVPLDKAKVLLKKITYERIPLLKIP
jgi:hypothetical protein